jgi:hypothetical protein
MMQGASCIAKSACFGLEKSCNAKRIYLAWIMRADGGRGHTKQALECTYSLIFPSRELKYHNRIVLDQYILLRGLLLRLAL